MSTVAAANPEASLPNRFRAARQRAGLTQRQLADLMEVQQPYISAIERGVNHPGLTVIVRAAQLMGCTPEEIEPTIRSDVRPGSDVHSVSLLRTVAPGLWIPRSAADLARLTSLGSRGVIATADLEGIFPAAIDRSCSIILRPDLPEASPIPDVRRGDGYTDAYRRAFYRWAIDRFREEVPETAIKVFLEVAMGSRARPTVRRLGYGDRTIQVYVYEIDGRIRRLADDPAASRVAAQILRDLYDGSN